MEEFGSEFVKILFKFYSNILDKWTSETMWATVIDKNEGLYKLDNIPFYAQVIASGDIVLAKYDGDEGMLLYDYTVTYSGNSTVHVIIMDTKEDKENIRTVFNALGCSSEGLGKKYFAMEVPAGVNYKSVKQKLIELAEQEVIDYAESCLSEKHQSDI